MNRTAAISYVGAALAALTFATTTVSAPTEAQRCLAAKEKALGKLESCVWKAHAKAETTGIAVDTSLCESKFSEAWGKPDAKYGADCPAAPASTISALFADHVAEVLAIIDAPASACGNGMIDAGEECDGANLNGESCSGEGYGNDGTLSCSSCQFQQGTCQGCSVFAQDCPNGADSCTLAGGGDMGCAPPGPATEGQSCDSVSCAESNVCISDGVGPLTCRQVCHVGGEPSCPSGYSCAGIVDYDEVGACLPN